MNILILSAGTRNKIVQFFRESMGEDDRIIAADCSSYAPALYEADAYGIVPRLDDPSYLKEVLSLCKRERVDAVLSLIDPELSVLAKHKDIFLQAGVTPVVSDYDLCETCLDKFRMYRYLNEQNIPTPVCYTDENFLLRDLREGVMQYPVFVKPVRGSASIQINKVDNEVMLHALFSSVPDLMAQEYMTGQEYGADAYIDLISGKCTSVFLKKKIKMRAGETDKAISVKDQKAFSLITSFAERAGCKGMIDLDLFLQDGVWYLSEVNPRFGGGYPHAYICGVNFMDSLIRNLKGEENPVRIGDYEEGIVMMKYNEICAKKF